jgi:hypothetical protein
MAEANCCECDFQATGDSYPLWPSYRRPGVCESVHRGTDRWGLCALLCLDSCWNLSLRSSLQRISSSQKHPEKKLELTLDSFHEFSCQMAFQLSICKATQQLRHQKTSCRCRFPRMTGLHSFVFSAYTVPLDRVEVDAYVVSVLGSSCASSETLAMERRTSRLDPRRLWLPSSVSFCWMRRVRVSLSAERAATITR